MALVLALLLVLALAGIGAVVLVSVGSDGAVARNQAWTARAAAQAEAGLELSKALLAGHVEEHGSFELALPPVRSSIRAGRGDPWGRALPPDAAACGDPATPGCRDYEVFRDEPMAGGNARVYVGRVLRDAGGPRPAVRSARPGCRVGAGPGRGWNSRRRRGHRLDSPAGGGRPGRRGPARPGGAHSRSAPIRRPGGRTTRTRSAGSN